LVAPANELAMRWIECWPDWPARGLVISGSPGSGKSHLASVWQSRSQAVVLSGPDLSATTALQVAHGGSYVVEAADRASEEPLLHCFNSIIEARGYLLLTADAPPAGWGIRLADLASRLLALPVATILPPDDQLTRAVLVKLFADRQTTVPPDVVEYLLPRLERSFAALKRAVDLIDTTSLAQRRRITVPLAREVIEACQSAD
jgi:chromosomal replication initiation ATPase DnaA